MNIEQLDIDAESRTRLRELVNNIKNNVIEEYSGYVSVNELQPYDSFYLKKLEECVSKVLEEYHERGSIHGYEVIAQKTPNDNSYPYVDVVVQPYEKFENMHIKINCQYV